MDWNTAKLWTVLPGYNLHHLCLLLSYLFVVLRGFPCEVSFLNLASVGEITSNNRWLVFCRICGLLHFPWVGSFGWLRVRVRNRVSNLGSTLCRFNPAIPSPSSYHCHFAFNLFVPRISLIGCVLSFSFCFALVLLLLPSWTGLVLSWRILTGSFLWGSWRSFL